MMAKTAPQLGTVQMLRLSDGRGLCVRRWPGEGPPLVLLHGLLDSSEGWAEPCGNLSRPRIAFDLPGFGYSDPPARGSIDGYASDIAECLEQLGVGSFSLLGHSLGGAVAAAVAELLPGQVTALVLLAPVGFGRIHLAELVSIPGVRGVVQAVLPMALASRLAVGLSYRTVVTNGLWPERDVIDRVVGRAGEHVAGAREGTRAVVDAGRSPRAFHRRKLAYDGPVFAVWGKDDRLIPASHASGLRAAVPHAEIEIWDGMGHHPIRERFDQLATVIERSAFAAAARAGEAARRPLPHAA
jgi:pimeloyl-ACP methyl ester carboxylesterase